MVHTVLGVTKQLLGLIVRVFRVET